VVRTLESLARLGPLAAGRGSTSLYLLPGSEFRVVTDLVTNFHLPRSSLLMLVAAFAGRERVLGAYCEAIETRLFGSIVTAMPCSSALGVYPRE